MESAVLIIHLLLALSLIGVVLMQRSEGGGLGIGGPGGGTMSGRGSSTPMGKLTWLLAIAFIATSIALTIIEARNSAGTSVVDRLGDAPAAEAADEDGLLDGESLLPPGAGSEDAPLAPAAE